jgi:hypothetical protein
MSVRTAALCLALAVPVVAEAQSAMPPRAIRRDIPITNAIRRAFVAGTRDSTGRPGRNYWQLKTDYTIRVSLDPSTQRLTGSETVTIHNASPDSLRNIVLRLDPNLFLGVTPHLAPWVPAEITDGMRITRMALDGSPVNLNPTPPPQGAASVSENGLFGANSSSARIALAKAIPAGATVKLEIDWNHKVPGGPGANHRMTQRWADTLFQPTQWYPRVAVYDDLRGWDTELYLGPSEFYNNFGRFDVSIDVPGGWIVSGTGVLQNPNQVLTARARERLATVLSTDSITTIVGPDEVGPGVATAPGDRLTWHLVADNVNDFAWATAKKFVWQATRATIPGKGPVPVNLYYLPGRAPQFAGAGQISRHALEFYSKLWFPYPFPQLTLQDGPSAGMEYPMVINSNRGAADHETGHQWWPMTVSNNETWYGWMDEGYDQYMNILSGADTRGQPANLNGLGQSYGRISGNEAEPPMMWNANYAGPAFYGFTTYSKTPLMLSMLGGMVGDSAVQRAHREWGQAWMWKHPSPWDWMFFMSKALNRELGWFWHYWLFTTESVDGSIAGVKQAGIRTTVTVKQDGQMPSPIVLQVRLGAGKNPAMMKNARMVDDSTAVVTFPVDVWFDGRRSYDAVLVFGGRKVQAVTLDPCGRFPDRDSSDNVWPRSAAAGQSAAGRGGQPVWPAFCTER